MKKAKNILLAMDHSLYAKRAARFLQGLQLLEETNLYVLHVIDPPQVSKPKGARKQSDLDKRLAEFRAHMLKNARQFVKRVTNQFQGAALNLYPLVSEGLVINQIFSVIEQKTIDLTVVGHQGASGIRRFLLGSVSEEIVNHASCSVLMVRTPPRWGRSKQPRGIRVLVAANTSLNPQKTCGMLRLMTFPPESTIEFLHVLEPKTAPNIQVESERIFPNMPKLLKMEKHMWERREREGNDLLKNWQQSLRQSRCAVKSVKVLGKGNPADVIINEAKERDVDLIIVGSRGLGAIQRMFLGSVSRKIVRHAPCSVLVIKPSKSLDAQ